MTPFEGSTVCAVSHFEKHRSNATRELKRGRFGELQRNQTSRQRMNSEELKAAINQTMPFGKYQGRRLIDLPEPYLVWFHRQGFPNSKLGRQLALMYEIKLNGLEGMLRDLCD